MVLEEDGREWVWTDPVEAYFAFRGCFFALAQALNLSVWTMEHLCCWYGEQIARGSDQKEKSVYRGGPETAGIGIRTWTVVPADREGKTQHVQRASEEVHRTHLEWLLARIGGDDHHWVWQQERLGDVSVGSVSLMTNPHRHQVLSHIDVLWFQKNELIAVYKIARTPEEIARCVLYLYDLGILFPKWKIALCVVVSGTEIERVQGEL